MLRTPETSQCPPFGQRLVVWEMSESPKPSAQNNMLGGLTCCLSTLLRACLIRKRPSDHTQASLVDIRRIEVVFSTHSFAVISSISVTTVDLVNFPNCPTMDRPK